MAWNYSPKEFIKVYRKLIEWEWYTDTNTKSLFIHCLLRANWKPGSWKGIHYNAGEFITSLPSLSAETGLSIQQVRTSLNRLFSTGELTCRTTDNVTGKKLTRNRIITVNNWDSYQESNSQNNSQNNIQSNSHPTGLQQATNRQLTADIRSIEYIRTKEEKNKNTLSVDVQSLCAKWNDLGLKKKIKTITSTREKKVHTLIDAYGMGTVIDTMDKICKSKFLSTESSNGWNITFDWFINPDNFLKVMEGQYDACDSETLNREEESEWQ